MIIDGKYVDGSGLAEHTMYDIHMHMIPGVDDGAWNLEVADSMLLLSSYQGISHIIVTPHSYMAFDQHPDRVYENFELLKKLAEDKYPEISLHLGCEVRCNERSMDKIITNLKEKIYPTMNGTRYVLVEFPTNILWSHMNYCITRLLDAQFIPIIAHAERYKNIFPEPLEIMGTTEMFAFNWLKACGCLIQVNTESLYDELDPEIRRNALNMLRYQMIDFLGTDAHDGGSRPPHVEDILTYLYQNHDKDYIDKIAYANAAELLLRDI